MWDLSVNGWGWEYWLGPWVIYQLFSICVSCFASNAKMIVWRTICKGCSWELSWIFFNLLSRYLSAGTEKNYRKLQSRYLHPRNNSSSNAEQARWPVKTLSAWFHILVTVHLGVILVDNQLDTQFLLYIFISILYMFRATLCSSSGESVVSIQHLVYVTLCRWPSGVQVGQELPDLHTGRSPTQSDIYQMLYWYNWLSWWWAQGCSKHVQNRNKYT